MSLAIAADDSGATAHMTKGRLEAFTDGVIAILITILVLELRAPHGATFEALAPLAPTVVSYILSFIYLAIYWNNHHHLMHAVRHVDGRVLWANIHLLFWLSLVPFATAWMGDNHFAPLPVALYGGDIVHGGGGVHDPGARPDRAARAGLDACARGRRGS